MKKRHLTFFMQFMKNPGDVGAILPTSRWVANHVIKKIPHSAKTIVEYGPGTGAVTLPLLNALPNTCELYVIENNHTFAKKLKKLNKERLHVIEGDAADCATHVKNPDVILSALPFRAFSKAERDRILSATAHNMPEHGLFIVYLQYTDFLERSLKKHFGQVTRSFEWRNIPPTYIFTCTKPLKID